MGLEKQAAYWGPRFGEMLASILTLGVTRKAGARSMIGSLSYPGVHLVDPNTKLVLDAMRQANLTIPGKTFPISRMVSSPGQNLSLSYLGRAASPSPVKGVFARDKAIIEAIRAYQPTNVIEAQSAVQRLQSRQLRKALADLR